MLFHKSLIRGADYEIHQQDALLTSMLGLVGIGNPRAIICSHGMILVSNVLQEFLGITWGNAKSLHTVRVLFEIDGLNPSALEQTFAAEENPSVGTFHVDF